MWKRTDGNAGSQAPGAADNVSASLDRVANSGSGNVAPRRKRAMSNKDGAVIGSTVVIKGDISGEEDVHILGRVEGSIALSEHQLTVGDGGHVAADITAREIDVEGEVVGDIEGIDKIVIRDTGRVKGNIKAPRVVLEEGAQFRGSVEMDVDTPSSKKQSSAKVTPLNDKDSDKDKSASA